MHARAHDEQQRERRGDLLVVRGLTVFSHALGVSGKCDVTEFYQEAGGVPLRGESGCWRPYPVEYKRGRPKEHDADRLQLCAQAMCLEEMLCCTIGEGALFYGETKRRTLVSFTEELRRTVRDDLEEMHRLYHRGYTPQVKPTKSCNACSLKEVCLPGLKRCGNVSEYLKKAMQEI